MTIGFDLGHDLDLEFSRSKIEFAIYLSQKWSDCHETKSKHIDWTLGLKCDHPVWPWPWPWPWIFKVKYRNCYISAKNGPIATKRKANISIELQGLKCDHQVWPWPWPWPWIFNVKYGISSISAKNGPIATKRKASISIELQASNVTNGFDLDHNLDLEFSTSNMEFPLSQPKMVRLPRNEKQAYQLNSRPQMWPMGLTLTITLTFEFWRSNVTLTFDHTHDLDHGFSWSNFEIAVSQNGRADWHCTKGVAVGHSWPLPFGDQGQTYASTR